MLEISLFLNKLKNIQPSTKSALSLILKTMFSLEERRIIFGITKYFSIVRSSQITA